MALPALIGTIARGAAGQAAASAVTNKMSGGGDKPKPNAKKMGVFGRAAKKATDMVVARSASKEITAANDVTTDDPTKLLKIVAKMVTSMAAGIDKQNNLEIDKMKAAREEQLEGGASTTLQDADTSEDGPFKVGAKQVGMFTLALGGLIAATSGAFDDVIENVTGVVDNIGDGFTNIVNGIKSMLPDWVTGGADKAGDVVGDVVSETIGAPKANAAVGMGGNTNFKFDGSGGRAGLQRGVYQAFRNAGFNHEGALTMSGEVGRENAFNPEHVFGYHDDPHNNALNVGMFSWQGSRGKKLRKFLKSRGLIKDGKLVQSQETLDAMAQFARTEMETGSHGGSKSQRARVKAMTEQMTDPDSNVSYEDQARVVGRDFIRWRYGDPRYASGHRNRRRFREETARAVQQRGPTGNAWADSEVTEPTARTSMSSTQTPVQKRLRSPEMAQRAPALAAARTPTAVPVPSGGGQQKPMRPQIVSPGRDRSSDYGWYFDIQRG